MTLYRAPGLRGLELWHGLAGGTPLYRLRDRRGDYFAGLREFLLRLHRGEADTENVHDTRVLRQARGFSHAVFCGGEAPDPLLHSTLNTGPLPFACTIDRSGPYAGRRGALRIFDEMGWRNGVALDLGQCQLKVMTETWDRSIPRDLDRLPREPRVIDRATGRERIREMIRAGLAVQPSADGIVLALPAALDRHGVARPSTYPGLSGCVECLLAGLSPMPWVVLNDAILAALGFQPPAGGKTVVITLGYGIGGALWRT